MTTDFERLIALRNVARRDNLVDRSGLLEVPDTNKLLSVDHEYGDDLCVVCNMNKLTVADRGPRCRQCVLMGRMFAGDKDD